jgi:ketosteroid isomerase-like protein
MTTRSQVQMLVSSVSILAAILFWSFQPNISNGVNPIESSEARFDTIVLKQAEAWNRGDLVMFMAAYWKDDRLTFSSGGETHRGWQVTFDRYRSRYPDRATMGHLTFTDLESQLLSPDSAMTLGKWHLDREKPVGGNFTLVWKKIDGAWFIIHDHSSSLDVKN